MPPGDVALCRGPSGRAVVVDDSEKQKMALSQVWGGWLWKQLSQEITSHPHLPALIYSTVPFTSLPVWASPTGILLPLKHSQPFSVLLIPCQIFFFISSDISGAKFWKH